MANFSNKSPIQKNNTHSEGVNMEHLLSRFRRFWYVFILVPLFMTALAWLFLRYQTPIYEVKNAVLIKDDKNKQGISTSDILSKEFLHDGNNKMLNDEISIMTSQTVLEEVARRLHLDRTVYLRGQIHSTELYGNDNPIHIDGYSLKDTTKVFKASLDVKDSHSFQLTFEDGTQQEGDFDTTISNIYGNFLISKSQTGKYADKTKFKIVCKSIEKTAKDLREDIRIEMPKKESNLLEPIMKCAIPEKAKNILHDIVIVYNKNNIEDKNEVSKNTLNFIESRISSLTGELNGVEQHVEQYKTREGITSDGNSDIGFMFGRLSEYDGELVKMEVQNSLLNSIEGILKKNDNSFELLPTNLELKSTGLQGQIVDYNRMVLERNRLLKVAGENHPSLKTLTDDLKNVKVAIIGNISRVKDENNALLVETKSKNTKMTDKLVSTPRKERQLTEIKRQQNIKEGLYLFLLQKQEETAISIAGALTDARVVDRPIVGDAPLSTKQPLVYAVAIFLGLLLGSAYAILQDFLTNTVQNEDDITAQTDMPILGKIPFCTAKNNLVIEAGNRTAVAEMFRLLRTDLQYALQDNNLLKNANGLKKKGQVVMVTCTGSGEGKSFISLNLGMSLAIAEKKTVVIGLDLRRPKISEYLSIPKDKKGISDYLTIGMHPEDIILKSEKNKDLFFIPSGYLANNPSELIMSPRMGDLFAYLKDNFEYIVIDTPPVGLVSDAFLLKPFVDMTLYVIRYGRTKRIQLSTVNRLFEGKKLSNPNIVFNGVKWDEQMSYGKNNGYYTKEKMSFSTVLNGVMSFF
jgi:tyrosine-protein kinase Etk/Wzc